MGKKIFSILIAFALIAFFISSAYAITGSIGNARMILRASVGDNIEKYILVKNVNNVSLTIELLPSGDLEEYIKIRENNFTLSPGGEKRAYFTINVAKNETTESQINVKFIPSEGNGVGLTSTIIVIASGEGEINEDENLDKNNDSGKKSIVFILLLATTGIILIIFVVLMLVVSSKNKIKNEFEKTKPKKSVEKK